MTSLTHQFVQILQSKGFNLWHFTDARNLGSIRELGLLRTAELKKRGVVTIPGGDEASLSIDRLRGFDDYVRLSFLKNHPMAHVARESGRIEQVRYLRIDPTVLLYEGVLMSDRVATANDAIIRKTDDMISGLDFEVMYKKTDWKVPEIQQRRRNSEKIEILVPVDIETKYITGF